MVGRWVLVLMMAVGSARAETVRFAHQDRFPPFVEVREGVSEGLFVDLLWAAAGREGIEPVLVPVPFEQVQKTLEDGRAEAIFPLGVTAERRATFDFSAAFLSTGVALYVRAPAVAPEGFAALAGQVVVTPGSGPVAAMIRAAAPDARLVLTKDYEESLAKVAAGEAAAAALNFHVGTRLAARLYPGLFAVPGKMFAETGLAVGVLKGTHGDLLARLDRGLAAIRADGTWRRIDETWMGKQ